MSSNTHDPVLAAPSGECCLKTVQHEGKSVGKTETIAGIETYVSEPHAKAEKGHKRVLLWFADVYGPFYINGQLVMDYYASHGWLVVSPDYFRGDPISKYRTSKNAPPVAGFDFEAWKDKHYTFAVENVPKWTEAITEKYGAADTKYATVGYCFGAPFVLNACAGDLVSAGCVAHPAFLNESHLKNSKKPMLFSCSEIDHTFPAEKRHIAEGIMAERRQLYHFQLFSGVEHGFALRGDMSNENERFAKEESASTTLRWFERFCN